MDDLKTEPLWLECAKNQIGVKEIPGKKNNPQIVSYHQATSLKANDDETAWCSSFVNWCLSSVGIKGTNSAAAKSFTKWGIGLKEPRPGAIAVMSRGGVGWSGHVGFYVGEGKDPNTVFILSGNQSNQVKVSEFSKNLILGYRWPK